MEAISLLYIFEYFNERQMRFLPVSSQDLVSEEKLPQIIVLKILKENTI
jgi:hypothetical protein